LDIGIELGPTLASAEDLLALSDEILRSGKPDGAGDGCDYFLRVSPTLYC
jgi:hypothetical protein